MDKVDCGQGCILLKTVKDIGWYFLLTSLAELHWLIFSIEVISWISVEPIILQWSVLCQWIRLCCGSNVPLYVPSYMLEILSVGLNGLMLLSLAEFRLIRDPTNDYFVGSVLVTFHSSGIYTTTGSQGRIS